MRAPLRAVTNEVNAAGPHTSKPAEYDESAHTITEWRRRWRMHMSEAVIYFDDIARDIAQSYKPFFSVLGTSVQPFFDSNVTHVVSNRQTGDVVAKARDKGIKVYTNDKLTRFMNSLVGYTPPQVSEAGQSAKLDQLLENEKRQNTVNAAYARKESDFHTFRGPYLLVFDAQHVHRPLAIKEWPAAAVPEDGTWPQLRATQTGLCPFATQRPKRRAQPEQPAPESHAKRRALTGPSAPGLAGLGLTAPDADAKTGARTAYADADGATDVREPPKDPFRNVRDTLRNTPAEDEKENQVPPAVVRAGATPSMQPLSQQQQTQPTQASARLREFGEIVASGVQRYSQTSTKSFAANVGPSREVADLKRKVLPTAPASKPRTDAKGAAKSGAKRPRKHGFCENCLERYEDLAEHLKTQSHVMFATNEKKFKPLDEALQRFQRNRSRTPLES